MAMMWLPFYNLGAPIGLNQSNNNLDIKLFWYMTGKVVGRVAGVMGGPPPPTSPSAMQEGLPPSLPVIHWWLKWSGLNGTQTPSIQPAGSGSQTLMIKLNQTWLSLYPQEFRAGTFVSGSVGQLTPTNLPGHMAQQGCFKSGWLGIKPFTQGPIRELPFYDLSAKFGTGCSNLPGDTALVTILLKMIQSGFPGFLKGISIPQNAIVQPGVVPLFAQSANAAGWPCSPNESTIGPAGPNMFTPSLTRALNHFAQKANPLGYLSLANASAANAGAALVQELQSKTKSQFF